MNMVLCLGQEERTVFRRLLLCSMFLLPASTGCLHVFHESPPIHPTDWRPTDEIPDEAKSCLYVFLIDSTDPRYCGSMANVGSYINELGFGKTFCGHAIHRSYFSDKVRLIQAQCPSARFAVISSNDGACAAQQLASVAAQEGITIDLLIYIEPNCDIGDASDLAIRSFAIQGRHFCFGTADFQGETVIMEMADRGGVPTHRETLDVLERELALIAMSIPPRPREPIQLVNLVAPIPRPRDKTPAPKPLPAEWRFLHPWGYAPESFSSHEKIERLPVPKEVRESGQTIPAQKTDTKN